ncbi:MAG: 30S ribosomal protein S5 [Planctomycetaceae bacterium]
MSTDGRSGRGDREGRGDHQEKTVQIRRCACVVKGGRRFSFTALVVVGDGRGKVGYGYGKAGEVPNAIEKATKQGGRSMVSVPIVETTIPHEVIGRFRSSRVKLIPAKPGTGLKAGEAVRAVVESAGISDILTKCYGSTNAMNVVKATFDALSQLRTRDQVARLRGVEI